MPSRDLTDVTLVSEDALMMKMKLKMKMKFDDDEGEI